MAALDRWRTCMTQTLQPIVSGNAAPFCPDQFRQTLQRNSQEPLPLVLQRQCQVRLRSS